MTSSTISYSSQPSPDVAHHFLLKSRWLAVVGIGFCWLAIVGTGFRWLAIGGGLSLVRYCWYMIRWLAIVGTGFLCKLKIHVTDV